MPPREPGSPLAVVIPHYNDLTRLARCLEALAPQADHAAEVLVVDNGSDGDVAALVAQYDFATLALEPQKGAGPARNRGVAQTRAPWIAFLDADCVPSADWLAQAQSLCHPDRITGGQITVFDETPAPRSGAEAFETVFAFDQQGYITRKGFSVTANLLTARAVFDAAGPFRTGVSEDLEWCRRACATGAALQYAPDWCVAHPTRQDWPALRRKWQRLTDEGFALNRPGPAGRMIWALKALAMWPSVLAHLPRILRHPLLARREKIRASATLLRLRTARMLWMLRQALGRPAG